MAQTYVTAQGDTWDLIAFKLYGDEKRAQDLMEERANIRLLDIQVFPSGVEVTAPEIDTTVTEAAELPEWRK